MFLVPWTYLPEGERWPELLHELGFKTVALALRDDSLTLNDPRLLAEPKLAMVLGTEGDGLASSTIAACDYTVKIPMSHGVDSLNVAAASAVAFYQLALLNGIKKAWWYSMQLHRIHRLFIFDTSAHKPGPGCRRPDPAAGPPAGRHGDSGSRRTDPPRTP